MPVLLPANSVVMNPRLPAQARAECEATAVAERFKTVSPLASASSATGTSGTLAMPNSEGAESGHKWKERWETLPGNEEEVNYVSC